jgi:putative membrane protein
MTGPAFLALDAPVTIALRRLPRAPRRMLLRLLHSRPAVVLSAPATAVLLDIGGLYALYLTSLYSAAERNDVGHAAVHLHMFLAGCLLSWAIIGVDPIRRRPGTTVRLAVLIIGAAGHETLAKLMYAHNLPAGGGSITGRHVGAELMYYGGTVIDLALTIIVMAQWYQLAGRELARTARRSISRPTSHPRRRPGSSSTVTRRDIPRIKCHAMREPGRQGLVLHCAADHRLRDQPRLAKSGSREHRNGS